MSSCNPLDIGTIFWVVYCGIELLDCWSIKSCLIQRWSQPSKKGTIVDVYHYTIKESMYRLISLIYSFLRAIRRQLNEMQSQFVVILFFCRVFLLILCFLAQIEQIDLQYVFSVSSHTLLSCTNRFALRFFFFSSHTLLSFKSRLTVWLPFKKSHAARYTNGLSVYSPPFFVCRSMFSHNKRSM
jgi:hypothetical protein